MEQWEGEVERSGNFKSHGSRLWYDKHTHGLAETPKGEVCHFFSFLVSPSLSSFVFSSSYHLL